MIFYPKNVTIGSGVDLNKKLQSFLPIGNNYTFVVGLSQQRRAPHKSLLYIILLSFQVSSYRWYLEFCLPVTTF